MMTSLLGRASWMAPTDGVSFDRKGFHWSPARCGAARLLAAASLVLLPAAAAQLLPGDAAAAEAPREAAAAKKPEAAEIRQKIAALAAPDETVPQDQQALPWLSERRVQIVPELIAALDDKNPQVAQQCLKILRDVPASEALTKALIAKASDEKSRLQYEALRQLERSAADPRVARLLDTASAQAERFGDPLVRARWAYLSGHPDRALEIVTPAIQKVDRREEQKVEAIRLLGEIGDPGGVALLEPIAAGDRWQLAVEAYRALAKIDPVKHGLTKDQMALLDQWWSFKGGQEFVREQVREDAKLSVDEIRPLLLQMLGDKDMRGNQSAALAILAAMKDKQALPQIRRLLRETKLLRRQEVIAALLTIDDGQQVQNEVLQLLVEADEFNNEGVVSGIAAAKIPLAAKTALLRAARSRLATSYAMSQALGHQFYQGEDIAELLAALMAEETDLQFLAVYCQLAALDKQQRFGAQIRRSMNLLSSDPTVLNAGENRGAQTSGAVYLILEAVAAYGLKDLAPDVQRLMGSRNPAIRRAAQSAGARLGVAGAIEDLYAELGSAQSAAREHAATSLLTIKPGDEQERSAREEAVLLHLGKPSEDFALRVLTTCGGVKSVKALEPILDDADPRRAVYAAWVLAQLPDETAAKKALRRVAIFGLFHHQIYQQGAGIDFPMAPDLAFHQQTADSNIGPVDEAAETPAHIPAGLLDLFEWDAAEQQFALRSYRLSEFSDNAYERNVDFLDSPRWEMRGPIAGDNSKPTIDKTHLPLLREIAAHDWHVERLMVQGQAVPHFQYRRLAAQAIVRITGEKATYPGLAGESLDSDAFPKPYPDRDQLLARFIVDRIEKARLPAKPQTGAESDRFRGWNTTVFLLEHQFGAQIVAAIRQEANRRKVNVEHVLPTR